MEANGKMSQINFGIKNTTDSSSRNKLRVGFRTKCTEFLKILFLKSAFSFKKNEIYNIRKHYSGGDYMIPAFPNEISTCPAGADLALLLNGKNLISFWQGGTLFHLVLV